MFPLPISTEIRCLLSFTEVLTHFNCTFFFLITQTFLTPKVFAFDFNPNTIQQTCRRYTKQICFALAFLHGTGVIHRDIKGDNILLTGDGIVKLADFGCSKELMSLQAKTHGVSARTMVGTPHWMAPEVIKNQEQGYGFTADIWSIGCTVVEMLTGKPPWPEFSTMWGAVFHIANSTGPPDNVPKDIPSDTNEFLNHCFERDTELRYTAQQLLETEWMTG